jgi:hypothetical protein
VAAPLAVTRCSTVGLDFSYSAAGATYAVRVERLTARAAKCSTARSLVSQVAEDLLHARRVPARLRGLTVGIIRPCAGCAPQYTGTATHAGERIAFVIAGGS